LVGYRRRHLSSICVDNEFIGYNDWKSMIALDKIRLREDQQ
jgi:hypothetical protein